MSDTPRTESGEPYGPPYNEEPLLHVPKAFARQLEHELNIARADLYLWKQMAEKLAERIQGVSDEDCVLLDAFQNLKEKTK